jgi:hypothetical protein
MTNWVVNEDSKLKSKVSYSQLEAQLPKFSKGNVEIQD